jgi:hypothetical protein
LRTCGPGKASRMTQLPEPGYRASPQTGRKSREARAARQRLPLVWVVAAGTIALVFVIGFVLAALL